MPLSNLQHTNNRYLYTEREFDAETGLYYYRARYYSPELGRFLQADPIGYAGGMQGKIETVLRFRMVWKK